MSLKQSKRLGGSVIQFGAPNGSLMGMHLSGEGRFGGFGGMGVVFRHPSSGRLAQRRALETTRPVPGTCSGRLLSAAVPRGAQRHGRIARSWAIRHAASRVFLCQLGDLHRNSWPRACRLHALQNRDGDCLPTVDDHPFGDHCVPCCSNVRPKEESAKGPSHQETRVGRNSACAPRLLCMDRNRCGLAPGTTK